MPGNCEHCGERDGGWMEDCHICDECHAEWRETVFHKCDHKWEPDYNSWNEAAHYCSKCSAMIANEDFPSLGLSLPTQA